MALWLGKPCCLSYATISFTRIHRQLILVRWTCAREKQRLLGGCWWQGISMSRALCVWDFRRKWLRTVAQQWEKHTTWWEAGESSSFLECSILKREKHVYKQFLKNFWKCCIKFSLHFFKENYYNDGPCFTGALEVNCFIWIWLLLKTGLSWGPV